MKKSVAVVILLSLVATGAFAAENAEPSPSGSPVVEKTSDGRDLKKAKKAKKAKAPVVEKAKKSDGGC